MFVIACYCGERVVDVPAKSLLAVKIAGRARPLRVDGATADETDVLRFTIANDLTTSRGGIASDPHRGLIIVRFRRTPLSASRGLSSRG